MLQNKIYQNYIIEILKTFITILLSLSIIAWTVSAVNFLDLIVENGYSIIVYFQYSLLNLFGILTKFIPLSFLIALVIFIIKQIQENELIILWTSGVKKIQLVHLFFLSSIFVSLFYLIFSVFISPAALNKSRQLLSNENLSSIMPTIKIQEFSDSFSGFTFIVDNKFENQLQNIFLQDRSGNLKNLTSNELKNSNSTIVAKKGVVKDKTMVLFDGQIISGNQDSLDNDIIKFQQLNIDLRNLKNTTIKKPKIQETSTLKLIGCIKNNFFKEINCTDNWKDEIPPILNRRIVYPLFFPLMALLSSFLLIKSKKNILYNKFFIFGYCFTTLLYAELIIRYTGISKIINNLFILTPIILSICVYLFLKFKFSKKVELYE